MTSGGRAVKVSWFIENVLEMLLCCAVIRRLIRPPSLDADYNSLNTLVITM